MAGSNVVAFKKALTALLGASSDLDGVQVSYGDPGPEVNRDCIYGGNSTFDHRPLAMRRAGSRIARLEEAKATLHLYAYLPGGTQEDAEERVVELGAVVENLLAADPRLPSASITGLLITTIDSGELVGGYDDDAAWAELTYTIGFKSELT